jgi:site-specific DNA-methyltransferase (adenine-specific)
LPNALTTRLLFPVELIEMLPTPGGLVLDPFAGIGSTLVAAKQLGLPAVGIEIDPA